MTEIAEHLAQSLGSRRREERRQGAAELARRLAPESNLAASERVEGLALLKLLEADVALPLWKRLLSDADEAVREAATTRALEDISGALRSQLMAELVAPPQTDFTVALKLTESWNDVWIAEELLKLLPGLPARQVLQVAELLSRIQFLHFSSRLAPLAKHENDAVRLGVAQIFLTKGGTAVDAVFFESCLEDSLKEVRRVGLAGARLSLGRRWVKPLKLFVKNAERRKLDMDEQAEALRTLGTIADPEAVEILMDFLFELAASQLQWICQQTLEGVDQDLRLPYLEKMLKTSRADQLPRVIEMIGHCEGRKPYLILKSALNRFKEPGLRSLLAAALGTIGYRECEHDLLALMEEDLAVAYAAAAALRSAVRERVFEHYETFLERTDIDELIKQTILQHIAEAARTLPVPESLGARVEDLLHSGNDNIRYLSVLALHHMCRPSSLRPLLRCAREPAMEAFAEDLKSAIAQCAGRKLAPLLEVLTSADGGEFLDPLRALLAAIPLELAESDFAILDGSPLFADWTWDEDLVTSAAHTHTLRRGFAWRQLARGNLSDKACRLMVRALEFAGVAPGELTEPALLIHCFSRSESEDTLLLLGRLMARLHHPEFLPPLIQFCERAEEGLQVLFRPYVRAIVLAAP